MSTHLAHHGWRFPSWRIALHLPRPARPWAAAWPAPAAATWLERLASWAERQPQHYRLGSYTRRG